MKKIILSLIALAGIMTSCDMDLKPEGVLDNTSAITTIDDCLYFRNGCYSTLRSLTCGSYIGNTEIQMDQFNGTTGNGSRGSYFANAQITSGYGDITSPYSGLYHAINNVLYFLENAEPMLAREDLTDNDRDALKRYIGEAKFARAFYYFWLMDHYCQAYTPEKGAQEGLGLSIVEKFNPTGDTSSYPGRSSMDDVLKLINDDLNDAYTALKAYEDLGHTENCKPNAPYISSYTVNAMQARVALATGDYSTAVTKAQAVIANANYQLAEGQAYVDMWINDEGSELIFVPAVPTNESDYIGSTCQTWNYWWAETSTSDYIPSQRTLNAYSEDDIRYEAFFTDNYKLTVEASSLYATVFTKYPGNDKLISGTNMYKNKPKPFRLSEQYLILAEAAVESNQATIANNALTALRQKRISGYQPVNYTDSQLRQQIRDERSKELIGEGFRMSDLRRWNLGFTRDGNYTYNPDVKNIMVYAGLQVSYNPGDYRYVWPIPADEMEINPQLAGQQNPGY